MCDDQSSSSFQNIIPSNIIKYIEDEEHKKPKLKNVINI